MRRAGARRASAKPASSRFVGETLTETAMLRAGGPPRRALREGLRRAPSASAAHQPGLLGQRKELAAAGSGRAVGCGQRTSASTARIAPAAQVELRLVVQDELAGSTAARSSSASRSRLPPRRESVLVEGERLAAELGAVHRDVRAPDRPGGVARRRRAPARCRCSRRCCALTASSANGCSRLARHAVGDVRRVVGVGVRRARRANSSPPRRTSDVAAA